MIIFLEFFACYFYQRQNGKYKNELFPTKMNCTNSLHVKMTALQIGQPVIMLVNAMWLSCEKFSAFYLIINIMHINDKLMQMELMDWFISHFLWSYQGIDIYVFQTEFLRKKSENWRTLYRKKMIHYRFLVFQSVISEEKKPVWYISGNQVNVKIGWHDWKNDIWNASIDFFKNPLFNSNKNRLIYCSTKFN